MDLVNRYQETEDGRFIVEALQLVEGVQLHLSRLIYQHIRDRDLRMDFVQDLYLKLSKALKSARIEKNCKGWFYRLVTFELINFNNRADNRRRSKTVPDIPEQTEATRIEEMIDQKDLLRDIQAFLGPEEWRYIELFHVERHSYRECAGIMNLTINQFRGRLERIRKKVVDHFKDR